VLIGRETETARLDELLDRARRARSGALVIRGEAGIGKTALLDYAAERAAEMTVIRTLGIESEAELEFAALLDVCRPLLDHVSELPERQAEALAAALGVGPSASEDRFAIGAATLGVLAAAAESRPVLVLVDDAQWLDPSSADALLFATRRLQADRVLVLYAIREGEGRPVETSAIETIALGGLTREDSTSLLAGRGELSPGVADRLYEATGGNPLALLQLPGLLSPEQLAGLAPLDDPLPAGSHVEAAFARRADALPEASRRALLAAAASPSGSLQPLLEALEPVGLRAADLELAEDLGFVRLTEERLEFRHPLMRSAVYHAAPPSERRAIHRALADALSDQRDQSLRAWHLAAASLSPDEEVAAALEAVAVRARERNAHAEAAVALEKAARLTPDPARRATRLTQAADAAWAAGDPGRALAVLDAAEELIEEAAARARLLHLRGRIERRVGLHSTARDLLLEGEELIRAEDEREAARMLQIAAPVLARAGDVAGAVELARRFRVVAEEDGSPLDAHADVTLGWALCLAGLAGEAAPSLERAVGLLVGDELQPEPRSGGWVELYLASLALRLLERMAEGVDLAVRSSRIAREKGPTALLSALDLLTEWEAWTGRWGLAAAHGEEGLALARQVGHADQILILLAQLARVDAGRGAAEQCRARVAEAVRVAEEHGIVTTRLAALGVAGGLELGVGRLDTAIEQLELVAAEVERLGIHDRDTSPHPDLVEALVRSGRREEGADVLARYAERAEAGTPLWGRALLARGRGMLAEDDEEADAAFEQALALHADVEDRFQHARTLLAFGERLRRSGRRRDARERLRTALALFDELGARPWAERARQELRASGETLRRRDPGAEEELTPQELQIALQVAEGKTNKEVGAALFLSHKTVEFHLGRIYRKLDLNSRAELIRRFAAGEVVVSAGK
jgi:DNA-binding CsgD family transcriptional regulator